MFFQSASHNAPIKTEASRYPILSIEGLLRLVEVTAKIQATQRSTQEEGAVCPTDLSPPACQDRDSRIVVPTATAQPQVPGIDTQSDAGEPALGNRATGGGQQ